MSDLFKSIDFNLDSSDEVVVVHFDLDPFGTHLDTFLTYLSNDELDRAKRFQRDQDGDRFVTCRGLLRALLAKTLDAEPRDIEFAYNESGKPSLESDDVFFNVTHSTLSAAIGFTRAGEMGVDIEASSRIDSPQSFAGICLSKAEQKEFASIDSENLLALKTYLTTRWVLKEAYLKALGTGLNCALSDLAIVDKNEPGSLLDVPVENNNLVGTGLPDRRFSIMHSGQTIENIALFLERTTTECWVATAIHIGQLHHPERLRIRLLAIS